MKIDSEIDIIFKHIDSLYWKGDLEKIDFILSQVTESLSVTLLVAYLTITVPHKEMFKHRSKVVDILKNKEPNRSGLWSGLE
ncbi:hypothetical protein LCGC14_1408910 [marine sediment metagenome]|uniref:Uncharacterized protein n=1 Tax=marine sediment metagenome TaxID=412755 RepID=A0A0F9MWG5_9ZZZZ